MDKFYGIHDDWPDLEKSNDVEIKSKDGVIESVLVNGEESGSGSGGGDFKKVTVTLSCTGGSGYISFFSVIANDGISPEKILDGVVWVHDNRFAWAEISVDYGTPVTADLLTFNDNILLLSESTGSESGQYTVTGDCEIVEVDGSYYVEINGDCTISTVGEGRSN